MSRPQSSDLDSSQISCLEGAWSELLQPTAAVSPLPSLHERTSSPQGPAIHHTDDGSAYISLLQTPACSTSTYRYFGECKDDVPHGFGIRIYTNSGSIGNSSNSFLPIPSLFSPPPSSHHDDASLNPLQKRANSSTGFSSV